MIDAHCHLEQPIYENDREEIIKKYQKHLKGVITSCAHPKDFDLTLNLTQKYQGFVFATVGIHPKYINEIKEEEVNSFLDRIKENKEKIVGIGETGLDYYWVREKRLQEKQKELFIEFISLSKELDLPLVIHARNSYDDTISILENESARSVMMHMFGANQLTNQVIHNEWYVSMNTIVMNSKKHKKVIRDTPIEQLLLETDSPWLAPANFGSKRNDSTAIKFVAEKISEIKRISYDEVVRHTTNNSIRFFNLIF